MRNGDAAGEVLGGPFDGEMAAYCGETLYFATNRKVSMVVAAEIVPDATPRIPVHVYRWDRYRWAYVYDHEGEY